jgi:hypothetical protein
VYGSLGRVLHSLESSAFAYRLEKTLKLATANEAVVEGVLLGLGAVALCFLLGYAIFVLVYCHVGLFPLRLF